jgi:hypothetical protein
MFFMGLEKIQNPFIHEFKPYLMKSERSICQLRSRISRSLKALTELQNEPNTTSYIEPVHITTPKQSNLNPVQEKPIKKEKLRIDETINPIHNPRKSSKKHSRKTSSKKQTIKLDSCLANETLKDVKKETRKQEFLSKLEEVKRKKETERKRQEELILKRMDYLRIGNDILFEEPILV